MIGFIINFLFCAYLSTLLIPITCQQNSDDYFYYNDISHNFDEDGGNRFPIDSEESLVLLHVLFRHGNRTANGLEEVYPNDPYLNEDYFPYGWGQLTNAGKKKEYSIGKALRSTYNNFLGEYYYPKIVEALSTDYNRTKMSLQLVLAGLFPPRQQDIFQENLYWQPIPYNYVSRSEDKLMLGMLCPYYLKLYEDYHSTPKMKAEFRQYKKIFDYFSRHSGLNVTRFLDVYNMYFGISTEVEYGFTLPSWLDKVWPETTVDLAIREYGVSMGTTVMRKMVVGYFLQKIVKDTRSKIISNNEFDRKIYLYSAHENNLAQLLISLDVFTPHIPNYGSYIVIEIHNINSVYGIKILYENHDGNGPQVLKMPGCDIFCPLDKFISLIEEYFPTKDLCGN